MNFDEPEHIGLIRDSLRRFVEREMPREAARVWDLEDRLPSAIADRLAGLGVMGLTVPETYGGQGRDIHAALAVIEELSKRSLALAVPYIMSAFYGGMNILAAGSERQKRTLLPALAAGRMRFAYGLTEPDVGADLASVTTRAERRGERVIVNGRKRFCTGAAIADFIYTLVKSDPARGRHENLSFVLVPPAAKGVTLERMDALGMRGGGIYEVILEDVEVPAENVVGEDAGWNRGWEMLAGPALDIERLEVAAMALGIAEAATADAWAYAQERRQFGKPIASHQAVRHALADARTKLLAARLVLYQAAWLANRDQPCGIESSMAKLFVCESAEEVVLACQRVMGAYGLVKGFDMERYARDILLFPIVGGSSHIQLNNIANRLGLPKA
ncbi:MAG: acyl-CoA dehydrogenase family protein [Alphaproteobacteria bacterium]